MVWRFGTSVHLGWYWFCLCWICNRYTFNVKIRQEKVCSHTTSVFFSRWKIITELCGKIRKHWYLIPLLGSWHSEHLTDSAIWNVWPTILKALPHYDTSVLPKIQIQVSVTLESNLYYRLASFIPLKKTIFFIPLLFGSAKLPYIQTTRSWRESKVFRFKSTCLFGP